MHPEPAPQNPGTKHVGWCETSAQHGETQPAHCLTYRSRSEGSSLFRIQTPTTQNQPVGIFLLATAAALLGRMAKLAQSHNDLAMLDYFIFQAI